MNTIKKCYILIMLFSAFSVGVMHSMFTSGLKRTSQKFSRTLGTSDQGKPRKKKITVEERIEETTTIPGKELSWWERFSYSLRGYKLPPHFTDQEKIVNHMYKEENEKHTQKIIADKKRKAKELQELKDSIYLDPIPGYSSQTRLNDWQLQDLSQHEIYDRRRYKEWIEAEKIKNKKRLEEENRQ